ncbi:hypothetical protein LCGC14_1786350 [marine sediment metagenome]|uniref:HNH nuclease domain-containing protein n=1 Tax=marine sediment metagenome TaxID=412755 RepID=A0A0F9HGG4_9ZZZZ
MASEAKRYLVECMDCGKERLITYSRHSKRRCLSCAIKLTWITSRQRPEVRTGVPYVGEIRYGREIGVKDRKHKYRWCRCSSCGYERWVAYRGRDVRLLCHPCARKRQIGEQSPGWKGGRNHHTEGYIGVHVPRDDFFFPMAPKPIGRYGGYVMEHRLVMARYLNRCLLPWEIVHHKNGVREDNRLENLELLPSRKFHIVDTLTKSLLKTMKERISYLERLLKTNGIEVSDL